MFWNKKKPKGKKEAKREALIDNANNLVKQKRAEIGDETLNSIKNAIEQRENSALNQAKKQIMATHKDKVLDNLDIWLKDK